MVLLMSIIANETKEINLAFGNPSEFWKKESPLNLELLLMFVFLRVLT